MTTGSNLIKKTTLVSFLLAGLLFKSVQAQTPIPKASGNWKAPHTLEELSAAPVALIPFPQQVNWTKVKFPLQKKVPVFYQDLDSVKSSALALQRILQEKGINSHIQPIKQADALPSGSILLRIDSRPGLKKEGYQLSVRNQQTEIIGADASGLFYGIQTLAQLIQQKQGVNSLPGCEIKDWPAFGLRGFLFDTGRNFREITDLKAQIDRLAAYKYNTFHWHLTDNPAWRPESKIFPQLNDPKFRKQGRDENRSYSFDEIRELIRYAAEKHIRVIPELDMPGHSAYFEPTFGFKMSSEQGMVVLEKLIDEFCAEIPAKDCPIIHIGSDEVNIPNPKEFMIRMAARVRANGRQSMSWNPGLIPDKGGIIQKWRDEGSFEQRGKGNPFVDSYGSYLNWSDALTLIKRYFFQQPCHQQEGDSHALGGILCCWGDTRVVDKSKILLYNPVIPGMITYSESIWCGRPELEQEYVAKLPDSGSRAWAHFREFEGRLINHRDRYFKKDHFPFAAFSGTKWEVKGQASLTGGVLNFDDLLRSGLLKKPEGDSLILTTQLYSDAAKEIDVWIGFETAVRSTRKSAGLPEKGQWDANGGYIKLNGNLAPAPVFANPGAYRYLEDTWEQAPNEIPFTDEEFYWTRKPAKLKLNKGWNRIEVISKRSYKGQDWMFAFVPVRLNQDGKWVEAQGAD